MGFSIRDQRAFTAVSRALVADIAAVEDGKSALVISPTHIEGERLSARIRERLKAAGKLCGEDRQMKNLPWTEAQRSDALNYRPDMIVQFHQNVHGFRCGERVKVKRRDGRTVEVERENGEISLLPLDKFAQFSGL